MRLCSVLTSSYVAFPPRTAVSSSDLVSRFCTTSSSRNYSPKCKRFAVLPLLLHKFWPREFGTRSVATCQTWSSVGVSSACTASTIRTSTGEQQAVVPLACETESTAGRVASADVLRVSKWCVELRASVFGTDRVLFYAVKV